VVLGLELRVSGLVEQVLSHLSHTSSPFYSGVLEMGSYKLFAQAGAAVLLILASQEARIIGMSPALPQ
jgi:hypothetical protein